jgi:DNA-binding winged helix-turn-helix (wHTH) protein
MKVSPKGTAILRFGPFELDAVAGELRKSGLKLRIPDQPLRVLTALAERCGEIVMREELAGILWPDGTQVDFENGLNAAVKKLRSALGDSGESPRYIEKVPRRGYRLLVPVVPLPPPAPESVAGRKQSPPRRRMSKSAIGVACAVVGSVVLWQTGGVGLRPYVSQASVWGKGSSKPEANAYFAKYELLGGNGMNELARAREMLSRALSIDPQFGKARVEYGFSCLMMIDGGYSNELSWLDRAEEEILQGLRDDPAYSRGHSALAAVLLYRGRREMALHETTRALEINPADVDARQWQAVYYWYSGDVGTARRLEQYNRARHPRFFPSRMNLADMARQEGNWEESLRELTRACSH